MVQNSRGREVGEVAGDGSLISIGNLNSVTYLEVCLQVDELPQEVYPLQDFGYTLDTLDWIRPLDIVSNVITRQVGSALFWCANVTISTVPLSDDDDAIRLFPIHREEDISGRPKTLSSRTEALVYTLGACYAIDFLLLSIFIVNVGREVSSGHAASFPVVAWIAILFIVVCIFRMCFMFILPSGEFEDNPLAEFIVFEIPTFLLFSVVIMAIGFWEKLARSKGFFLQDKAAIKYAVIVSLILIWALWIIVTVIYAEVILDQDATESPCPGRVQSSSEQIDDDTRRLSVAYQSIIIAFSFLLGILFAKSSYSLFNMSKKMSRAKTFIFRLAAIIVPSFLLRCIFFIIILAGDFTSAIYMFIVLMVTEVFMMFLAQLQFNGKYFERLFGNGTSNVLPSGVSLATKATSGSTIGGSIESRMDD